MTGGRLSCGCKRCKSSGPNGGSAAVAGGGRLSCRLGVRTVAAARSAHDAFDRCWLSRTNGPSRWPQANCASRANARTKKIPERRNTSDTMELTLPAESFRFEPRACDMAHSAKNKSNAPTSVVLPKSIPRPAD